MKSTLSLLALMAMLSLSATAQTAFTWFDPQDAPMQVIEGQAFPAECKGSYMRFSNERMSQLPGGVAGNGVHSAGLTLRFHTDASEVRVKYTTTSTNYSMHHMPATGMSGVDLYATDSRGHSMVCHARMNFGEEILYRFTDLTYHEAGGYDYELFFPLYNGVKTLSIGVPEGATFRFMSASNEKPILVYGTSIAHGACASRPAMAWVNILKRELQLPFVNWGFSGSGRMEPVMFEQMAEVDARLYIIDCMPNMNDTPQEIFPRLTEGIRLLRAHTDAPILIVEHDGYTTEETRDISRVEYQTTNVECRKAYEQLKHEGVKGLWYLSHEEIGMSAEATVDDTHASDLGMVIYAKAYTKKIRKILHLKK